LREKHQTLYEASGRWWLTAALAAGFIIGAVFHIPASLEAIVLAFVAGGVLLNVLHYELPKKRSGDFAFFVLGGVIYTFLIVQLGSA
jgi:hypothetical protein